MGFRGPEVKVDKPPGRYRIVLLGESTTFGYGVNDEATIDAHMRRLLAGRFSGQCFEVVNLALGGYDSYQIYERMRVDGVRLRPDLVIINSGINDVRNALHAGLTAPPDPRTLIWEPVMKTMREEAEHGRRFSSVAQHYSYAARVPGYLLEVLRQRKTLTVIQATEPDTSAEEYFATNIRRTAGLAFDVGAAVILSSPPSAISRRNKPSDPPEKSYWIRDAGTTEEYRRRLAVRMKAISEVERGQGRRIGYASHDLPVEEFLDDAHLTGEGNRSVARKLVDAAGPFIDGTLVEAAVHGGGTTGPQLAGVGCRGDA
jgi:lysophospholipase L1-like esterase